jgi:hypothetical protein
MPNPTNLHAYVIPWMTSNIWQQTPFSTAKCRGCGIRLPAHTPAYQYIYGWYRGNAKQGFLCEECGRKVLWTMIEKAAELLPKEWRTAVIRVEGGAAQNVTGLPPGWHWDLADFDNCSVCGGLDDDCPNCRWPDGPAWSGDG